MLFVILVHVRFIQRRSYNKTKKLQNGRRFVKLNVNLRTREMTRLNIE